MRLTLTYSLAIVFLLCVLHHVEARYFAPLLPLNAVAIGAAVVAGTLNGNDVLWNWAVARMLRPQLIFDGPVCDVYRLNPVWR